MNEERPASLKVHYKLSSLVLILTAVLILGTIIPSILAVEKYNAMCICTINYLAHAWIALAVTALVSLISVILCAMSFSRGKDPGSLFVYHILLWLQAAGFIIGLILMLVFITRFTGVL